MEDQTGQTKKKKSKTTIVLIIVAIVVGSLIVIVVMALLATDTFLYMQKNKSDTGIVYRNNEKTRLQTQLDSLKDQLDQANGARAKLSGEMQAKSDSLDSKIKVLQTELIKGKLTDAELRDAKEDINRLRYSVTVYEAEIAGLKKNDDLTTERDTMKTSLAASKTSLEKEVKRDTDLIKQNGEKAAKLKTASAIKLATINIVANKITGGGKGMDSKRVAAAKKIKINFNVATNDIAEKGMHDVYVRVVDPTGNLITESDSGNFNADGQDLQFTYKSSIDFKNDNGITYSIDWVNPVAFQKGTYTVLLYADGYTMGKSSFELK